MNLNFKGLINDSSVGKRSCGVTRERSEMEMMQKVLMVMKMQEMISLSYIKSRAGGVVKKMLHVPTMTIHAVKETPMCRLRKKDVQDRLLEIIEKYSGISKLVRIYSCHFNQPEGCLSIVLEYQGGNSLANLIQNCGFLNEQLVLRILKSSLQVRRSYLGRECPSRAGRLSWACQYDSGALQPHRSHQARHY
jgi:serine/threonine protein kinase